MKTKNIVRKLTIIYGWLEANFFFQLLLLIYMHYSHHDAMKYTEESVLKWYYNYYD